jgi:hypothetical protein
MRTGQEEGRATGGQGNRRAAQEEGRATGGQGNRSMIMLHGVVTSGDLYCLVVTSSVKCLCVQQALPRSLVS